MKAIADTGLIVAFGNRTDRFHPWAVEIAKAITEPLLTCEAVLAEAAFHLRSVPYVLSLVEDGMLRIAFEMAKHQQRLAQLAERYQDRHPDLADLCLIRLSELFPRHTVITVDEEDFRIYRRNHREAIPILCPPRWPRRQGPI
jgi:predicted nucleic acid-binding protein